MRYPLLLIASFITLFCSCTRTTTVTCTKGSLVVYGVGFNSTDIDGSVLYTYKADGAFDSLIDSSNLYSNTGAVNDTTWLTNMNTGTDYIISFPTLGSQYKIAGITQDNLIRETFTYSSGPFNGNNFYCMNGVHSCEVNGTAYYPPALPSNAQLYGYGYNSSNALYINK